MAHVGYLSIMLDKLLSYHPSHRVIPSFIIPGGCLALGPVTSLGILPKWPQMMLFNDNYIGITWNNLGW